ncbi:hypothetical protein BC332_12621 [Capsicum chinense]|nr:hypothetical protein BC332_12621 [Capsicum chinense]
MKERDKATMLETDNFSDFNYSISSDMPCKNTLLHLLLVYVLIALKRIGSVGRISFLLENEKIEAKQQHKREKTEQVIVLRRSNSSCVEIKKSSNGFWKIKRLFTKKKGVQNGNECDENSDIWVSDAMAVSRSRSVCNFRGGGFNDTDKGSD